MNTDSLRLAEHELTKMRKLEVKLNEAELKLNYCETKMKKAENDTEEFRKYIEELKQTKKDLEDEMIVKNKETQNKINQLELEKTQTGQLIEEFQNEIMQGKVIIRELEEKLQQVILERAEIEEKIKKEYDETTSTKMRNIEQEYLKKLIAIEAKAETDLKHLKEEYSQDYVRRTDFEQKLKELINLQKEIIAFKSVIRSYEEKVNDYEEKEKGVEYKIQEYQETITALRKDLDKINAQYSETILEKTKLTNEKTILEQEVNKYKFGGSLLKQKVEDIKTDFEKNNVDCQRQIKYLQKCKSELEMKISEMESTNAELYNKLVKIQVIRNEFNYSMLESLNKTSQPTEIKSNRKQVSLQICKREKVLADCSNHEDVILADFQATGDIERVETNYSPDLGIESDKGRFSSLEIQDIPRPLLHTLELSESMNNLLVRDGDIPPECFTCSEYFMFDL